jgi:hypothetical protein
MAFYLIAVLRLRESRHGREIVFLWARGCGLCLPLLPVATKWTRHTHAPRKISAGKEDVWRRS